MSFFNKLFGKKKTEENFLDRPIEEVAKERSNGVNVGRSIFPVIKSEDDPRIRMSLSHNPIITEKVADGIVVCYVLDIGHTFEMIAQKFLEEYGLSLDDIKQAAYRNLVDKINEDCKISIMDFSQANPQMKPFYKIDMNFNFNPSMMLIDEFWETTAQEILNSDTIAVSIPAKNLIFFSDMKLMESFRTMRPIASQFYDVSTKENIELTKNTYIRKNGKWVLFLDTAEQIEELLDL